MKKFSIKVNGNDYEVEVEELGGNSTVADTPAYKPARTAEPSAQTQAPAAPKQAPAQASSKSKDIPAGSTIIEAPMPGTILKVAVNPGDSIKKGDLMIVLEAMKMENELVSPVDGTVGSVNAVLGAAVNSGDVLLSIK